MNFRACVAVITLAGIGAGVPWVAMAAGDAPAVSAAAGAGYASGEVKKIDTEQGKITLKHGPIDNLGMPGMTMVFRADAATLAKTKVGETVRFKADKVDGAFKVTDLQPQ